MRFNTFIKLKDLVRYEINRSDEQRYKSEGYCIYWSSSTKSYPTEEDKVFIAPYPDFVEEKDEDVEPSEVTSLGLSLVYRDELV
ncbi:hypothetical protein MO867_17785 [Microbulbifer sp. OS29]|uniref:Uncharacterized protein n=1 Tax=Microbulbifer okhotskensis TaxID=2926617 RepID=A0A9X2EPR4_9GAMM|nr:hypothetical protein [Microbulbifer okhotskensis]MCO1336184.1 hypothetical protein [Microbulbifer okhotskensis]